MDKIIKTKGGVTIKNLLNDKIEYNNNPINCLYDYLTNERYGLGISESRLLPFKPSLIKCAQYCEEEGLELNTVIIPTPEDK